MPPSDAVRSRPSWVLAFLVWTTIFASLLVEVSFLNDHFDRIARGRQILAYGEHPFADFRDPGYFLTLYVSAAAQAATRGGLLGEAVVSSAAIATAGTATLYLAAAASGSLSIGLLAACLTLMMPPRYYDYDKVFFYVTGLALCWRYVDVPTPGRVAAVGFVTAVAALFRYDNGLFLLAACVAAIVVTARRDPARLVGHVVVYLAVIAVTLTPALLFLHFARGLGEVVRQVTTYAAREGRRSELFRLPPLLPDRVSVLYILSVVAGPVALLHVGFGGRKTGVLPSAGAKILAAAVLCACVCIFVLRDPVDARVGAAVPLLAVLAAAIAGQWASRPRASLVAILVGVACLTTLAIASVPHGGGLLLAPSAVGARLRALAGSPREHPRASIYFPDNGALDGLATYLRTCTPPHARALVTWFAPEVYYFSERGFAGGMAVVLGTHWSSDADQRRTIEQMTSQLVPLVIVPVGSEAEFRATFRQVAAYLDGRYGVAGTTSFGDPRAAADGYRVFVRRDLAAAAIEPRWMLPCPR